MCIYLPIVMPRYENFNITIITIPWDLYHDSHKILYELNYEYVSIFTGQALFSQSFLLIAMI